MGSIQHKDMYLKALEILGKNRRYLIPVLQILICLSLNAQSHKQRPYHGVYLPDSISRILEIEYAAITSSSNVFVSNNVWNLNKKEDLIFKNGLFSFKGLGPHFPRCIFIFKNPKIYIFRSIGAFDFEGVLQGYLECIKQLGLSEKEKIRYLKLIATYLESESGQTYGTETSTE